MAKGRHVRSVHGGLTYWRWSEGRWRWKGDTLQMDQFGILEHGSDRLGTLRIEVVVVEPAARPRVGMSEVLIGRC